MLKLIGRGHTAGNLPLPLPAARDYFADVAAFLRKIEHVDELRPIASRPGAYLVTHHPVGGLGYHVVVVACLEGVWEGDTMRLRPLDFDLEKVKSAHPTVKGFIQGDLALRAVSAGTSADFGFGVTVELPIPAALSLVPTGLVKATADSLMSMRCESVAKGLFRKVMDDFATAVV